MESTGTTTTDATIQPVEQSAQPTQPTDNQVQTQGAEESFFDPNSIPEELKPAYKQMQAAFTKKTTEAAEVRKEAEALRQKAELYERYQQHIPMIEKMLAGNQPQKQSPELTALEDMYRKQGYSDEAIEMMKMGIGFALNQMNQKTDTQRQQDWVNSQIVEASRVDSRLNDQNLKYSTEDGESFTYGQMVEQYVAADPNWQKDPVAATKRAIKRVDALIGKAKTEGKEELSQQAKAKVQKFPASPTSPQSTSSTNVKGSIRDIGKQTAAELGIKL